MGKVKRLELWWQLYLYVTSGSGLRNKTSDHFMCVWVYRSEQYHGLHRACWAPGKDPAPRTKCFRSRGSLLFIIHTGMSQLRHRRAALGRCFLSLLCILHHKWLFSLPPSLWFMCGGTRRRLVCRYVHNLPETVSHDLLWGNYAVQSGHV
jgi:hypothetical protein